MLALHQKATQDEIHRAYHSLVTRYHPDKHEGNELQELAAQKLTEINQAYQVLKDPDKRAAYDATLRGRGVDTAPAREMRRRPVSLVGVLIVVLGLLVGVRFVRSFRVLLVLAAVMVIAWFGPRIWQRLKRRDKNG